MALSVFGLQNKRLTRGQCVSSLFQLNMQLTCLSIVLYKPPTGDIELCRIHDLSQARNHVFAGFSQRSEKELYSGLVIIISQNSSKSMEPEPSSSSSSRMPSSSSLVRGASSSPMRPLRVSVVMQPRPSLSQILQQKGTLDMGKKNRDMLCTIVLLSSLFCLVN